MSDGSITDTIAAGDATQLAAVTECPKGRGYRIAPPQGSLDDIEDIQMTSEKVRVPLFFITGLSVGLALTALFAPRSGAATRRVIERKSQSGEDWVKDKADVAVTCLRRYGESLWERTNRAVGAMGRS